MKESDKMNEFNEIEGLIREEEERALESFRKGHFEARVQALIEKDGKIEDGSPFLRRLPLTAAGLAIIAVAIGILIVTLTRKPSPLLDASRFEAIVASLEKTPGLESLKRIEPSPVPESTSDSGFSLFLQQAKVTKEELKHPDTSASSFRMNQVPSLSLREKTIILFHERVIERALVMIKENTKEA